MSERTMWAVQFGRYGGPEVLELGSAPRPRPAERDVLVEVAAFSVNAIDLLTRRGRMRALDGIGFAKGTGVDFSGIVRETGPKVGGFRAGDRVWGYLGMKAPGRAAAAAQYVAIRAGRVTLAPASLPLEQSAALPLTGLTALTALRTLGVREGTRLLVVGGNGGVGSTAVQVAGVLGASVDAVVGARGEVAAAAGARRTFDYRVTTPHEITERYDAVLDTAATDLLGYRRLLAPGGRIAALSPAALPAVAASALTPGPTIRMVSAGPDAHDLTWLAEHVDTGRLKPLVAATYPVGRVADAHRDAEEESAAGKRVVAVGSP